MMTAAKLAAMTTLDRPARPGSHSPPKVAGLRIEDRKFEATDEAQVEHGTESVFHPCFIRGSFFSNFPPSSANDRRSNSFNKAGRTVKQESAHRITPLPAIQPSSATPWKSASIAA